LVLCYFIGYVVKDLAFSLLAVVGDDDNIFNDSAIESSSFAA
jgi:hypothetical protein